MLMALHRLICLPRKLAEAEERGCIAKTGRASCFDRTKPLKKKKARGEKEKKDRSAARGKTDFESDGTN